MRYSAVDPKEFALMVSMAQRPLVFHQSASILSVSGGLLRGPIILFLRPGSLVLRAAAACWPLLEVHGWLSRMSAMRMSAGVWSLRLGLMSGVPLVACLSSW